MLRVLALSLLLAAAARGQVRAADADVLSALGVGHATVQTLALPGEPSGAATVEVVLDGETVVLELAPTSVRAPGFTLLVQGADGAPREVEAPPPSTVRGLVRNRPDSAVSGSLEDGRLTALVLLEGGERAWSVQPLAPLDNGAAPGEHVVFDAADAVDLGVTCGTFAPGGGAPLGPAPALPEGPDGGDFSVTLIACDADFEYFESNNSSVNQTTNDIETVVNNVTTIYEFTAGITYQIGTIIVRTSPNDPYFTTNASGMLSEFRNEWNVNQTGVSRNVAHLFTGKDLSGSVIGIAWLDVNFCASPFSGPFHYGVSQSKFSANTASRTGLTAHELGHNWSASHCDGIPGCQIMCSGLGGCEGLGAFGPTSTNAIWNKLGGTPCLDQPGQPTLVAASPPAIDAFFTGMVTIEGSNLFGIEEVTLDDGTGPVSTSFTSTSASEFTIEPLAISQLGEVEVQIETLQGTSNTVTYEVTGATPPKLQAPSLMASGFPFTYTWLGEPAATSFLLVAGADATLPFQGFELLWPGFVLAVQPLDALGMGSLTVVPPPAAIGLTFYTQVLTQDGTGFLGTSTVESSWVVF